MRARSRTRSSTRRSFRWCCGAGFTWPPTRPRTSTMSRGLALGPALGGAFAIALALAPLALGGFTVTLLNYIGIYTLVALGLVLLTGCGGITSFGQAAFVGVGAYATAYLSTTWGVSPWLGLAAGIALSAAIALVLGYVTPPLRGPFPPPTPLASALPPSSA